MAEDGRTFLRGIGSETYGLKEFRARQRSVPRVRRAGTVTDDGSIGHSGDSDEGGSKTWWMLWTSWKCDLCNAFVVDCFLAGGDSWNPGDA